MTDCETNVGHANALYVTYISSSRQNLRSMHPIMVIYSMSIIILLTEVGAICRTG